MKIRLFFISISLVSANSIYSLSPQDKLFKGVHDNCYELVDEALKEGADVNLKNQERFGETALIYAMWSHHGDRKMVEKLLCAGANVNSRDNYGLTTLMLAANKGDSETVATLLKAGASLNFCDNIGDTALMHAIKKRRIDIVRMLIEAGVDIFNKHGQRWSAIDIAIDIANSKKCDKEEKELDEIAQMLQVYESSLKQQKAIVQPEMTREVSEDLKRESEFLSLSEYDLLRKESSLILDFLKNENQDLVASEEVSKELKLSLEEQKRFMFAIADGDEAEVIRIINSGADLDFFYYGQCPLSIVFMEELIYDGNKKRPVKKNKNIFEALYKSACKIIDIRKLNRQDNLEDSYVIV